MQKLILPLTSTRLTASIKTAHYKKTFGFEHYGADMVNHAIYNKREFRASGDGIVRDFGYDANCGNVLIVEYKQAYNHYTKRYYDIVIRYFHLAKILVKKAQKVTQNTILGQYGMTGKYGGRGPHIHMEIDSDTKYIWYTPTLASGRYLLKGRQQGANDKMMFNPLNFMYIGYNEQYATNPDKRYIRTEDTNLPKVNVEGPTPVIGVGDTIIIKTSATNYSTGQKIADKYKNVSYIVQKVLQDRVLIKELYSWVNI